jgi:hypothetical protein
LINNLPRYHDYDGGALINERSSHEKKKLKKIFQIKKKPMLSLIVGFLETKIILNSMIFAPMV